MKTISSKVAHQLSLQKEEAQELGLTKVATFISKGLNGSEQRTDEESYSYSQEELYSDLETKLAEATMRVCDYFNVAPDSRKVVELVDDLKSQMFFEVKAMTGVEDGIGPYEPIIVGEKREETAITINEDE